MRSERRLRNKRLFSLGPPPALAPFEPQRADLPERGDLRGVLVAVRGRWGAAEFYGGTFIQCELNGKMGYLPEHSHCSTQTVGTCGIQSAEAPSQLTRTRLHISRLVESLHSRPQCFEVAGGVPEARATAEKRIEKRIVWETMMGVF